MKYFYDKNQLSTVADTLIFKNLLYLKGITARTEILIFNGSLDISKGEMSYLEQRQSLHTKPIFFRPGKSGQHEQKA